MGWIFLEVANDLVKTKFEVDIRRLWNKKSGHLGGSYLTSVELPNKHSIHTKLFIHAEEIFFFFFLSFLFFLFFLI